MKIPKPQTKENPTPRKLKKPEHFDEVYFSWINGGMTMEEAAMLLGITEKRFYIFLNEILDDKIKVFVDLIIHIIIYFIGFATLYAMYKAGV